MKREPPVALFIYNRPQTTARVFAAIRQARPAHLLLIADGPKADDGADAEQCAAARAAVEDVGWPCEVRRDYAPANLGIRKRIDSGLAWIFEQFDQAIILEDDCLPHPSFFPYCAELLAKYREERRIMTLSGDNFLAGRYELPYSYAFSRYALKWGWATWRRAWETYDPAMSRWPELRDAGWLETIFDKPAPRRFWTYHFNQNYHSAENWDLAWNFSCWRQDGLGIIPRANLISNTGFHAQATHTRDPGHPHANLPLQPMSFPLQHPPRIQIDEQADAIIDEEVYSGREYTKPLFKAIREQKRNNK